jgi:hypothetical protein
MKNKLIEAVIKQIEYDFGNNDLTALEELLKFIPQQYLEGFISEDELERIEGEQA